MSLARVATVLIAVGLVALLGVFAYRLFNPGAASTIAGGGRVNQEGRAGDIDPHTAPDFTLEGLDGEEISLSDYAGQVVVLNFWASWCPPCEDEAPAFERVWRSYQDRGVVLLGVNVWDEDEDAEQFLAEHGITYPNGKPTGALAAEYGLTGIPETFVVDAEGMIVRRWFGPLTEQELTGLIDSTLAAR